MTWLDRIRYPYLLASFGAGALICVGLIWAMVVLRLDMLAPEARAATSAIAAESEIFLGLAAVMAVAMIAIGVLSARRRRSRA